MPRDTITSTGNASHWGYGHVLQSAVQDALLTQHNEHAAALDSIEDGDLGGAVASGTVTCTTKANYADSDYMTIGDGIQAPKLYEFDTAGNGVTSGRVQVNISASTDAHDVALVLKTAIQANQPLLLVTEDTGVLTLTSKLAGTFANVTITENVANAGHTVTGMLGGVDPAR